MDFFNPNDKNTFLALLDEKKLSSIKRNLCCLYYNIVEGVNLYVYWYENEDFLVKDNLVFCLIIKNISMWQRKGVYNVLVKPPFFYYSQKFIHKLI